MSDKAQLNLEVTNLSSSQLKELAEVAARSNGLVIVCGEGSKPQFYLTRDSSVAVTGSVTGSTIQTGDRNVAAHPPLPPPDSVDIKKALRAIRRCLARLDSPDQQKIKNALSDAEHEIGKESYDADEVGKALERALHYSRKANQFAEIINALRPHVVNAAAWLGRNWHKILAFVGLAG